MLSLADHPKIYTSQDEITTIDLPKDKTIVIDMGCGHGDYMLAHCPDDKDVFWIGVDISRKRAIKTEKRLLREYNSNFILFADDGQDVLSILPANSIDIIHINFPDPWLRDKQWKNRLFRPSFVTDLVRVLKKGGVLSFVTDIKEYADSVAEILTQFPQWTSIFTPMVQENIFQSFPTLFYRKMSPLRPISYIKFHKI
ncbi:MAG: methyltransferase domain-containing protein [Spirochaetota bacterium]|nr:methyltransferase domain-containing protein [Spirochaetota bacterium]